MDGINIYLGIGIILFLAGLLGQIKGLGFEIPLLSSRWTRFLLVLLGAGLVVAAYVAPLPGAHPSKDPSGTAAREEQPDDGSQDRASTSGSKEASYRKQVLATCAEIAHIVQRGRTALPVLPNGKFDKDGTVRFLDRQMVESRAVMAELWRIDAPSSLRADQESASVAMKEALDATATVTDDMRRHLPAEFTGDDLDRVIARTQADQVRTRARVAAAMTRLAGEPCRLS